MPWAGSTGNKKLVKAVDAELWYKSEANSLGSLDAKPTVLFKTHELTEEPMKLCQRAIAFTSHRSLDDKLRSAAGAGWMPARATNFATIRTWATAYRRWKLWGAIDVNYNEALKNPSAAFRVIIDHVAFVMNVKPSEIDKLGPIRAPSIGEANPGIPSSASKSTVSEEDILQEVTKAKEQLASERLSSLGLGCSRCDLYQSLSHGGMLEVPILVRILASWIQTRKFLFKQQRN
ncbi:hypothetical protein AURANDRAFT_68272 [Aureococcus anophagefferens]|uniref:Uncharacterized protein n=1 Tax=Aureococcus anophagefferens TaxID=44056 RepID=F0YP27_AURAN|nr:hypothetical protein AURANDRAFT_68272 [Aureococcus anophagefferens]EGB03134.1 hypothetical protein AURANDRAFT_68272 [Aureococcus anophagefferens]|eukprot:XP_009042169.1 hypothetical protein AURANDRAFT_68272 [Aureococcus anophagefferens]